MQITKTASEDYECAIKTLSPFEQSSTRKIASAAKYGVVTYQRHVALNDEYLNQLRAPDISGGIPAAADRLSTIAAEKQKLWLDLGILAEQSTARTGRCELYGYARTCKWNGVETIREKRVSEPALGRLPGTE